MARLFNWASRGLLGFGLCFALATTPAVAAVDLRTTAERSGFQQTGRYAEVIELCAAFARRYPRAVRCIEFGRSPEGRRMQALVVSHSGALSAEAARRRGLPVVLVQGGIHAGEIDGKDAGFLLLRELLAEPSEHKDPLRQLVLVFVPVFNVDGHERFKAWNRPNQRGPEQMGWRTTAQNYNLNRDYAKAQAPEMQAMLALVQRWDPVLTMDLHVTDGAKFEHDVSIQVEPLHAGDSGLMAAGSALSQTVRGALSQQGSLPLDFYPSFVENDNPASGFVDSVAPPRFSTGYFWLRNRYAMLVETHSWKDYPTRVRITRNTVLATLQAVADQGKTLLDLVRAADRRASQLAGQAVPLDYVATAKVRTIDFRGYAYTRKPSAISGGLLTHYDEQQPQIWKLPMRDELEPGNVVQAPAVGYLVPPQHAARVAALLKLHGIRYQTLDQGQDALNVQVFKAQTHTFAAASVEGNQRLTVTGEWRADRRSALAGSLLVPIDQPLARLVMALLEPRAPDALLAWGLFNNAFEQKEYMEAYVAESVAADMLQQDPALAAEFAAKLASDPAFAASPDARLDFFYRRHSAWDERYQEYPVLRLER